MSDDNEKPMKRSGYGFIAAGVMFFVAAATGRQLAFIGVGVMFVGIGISHLMKSK